MSEYETEVHESSQQQLGTRELSQYFLVRQRGTTRTCIVMAGGSNFWHTLTSSHKSANKITYVFMEPEMYLNIIQKFNLYLTENKLCIDLKSNQ
jgi:hypothetical protein